MGASQLARMDRTRARARARSRSGEGAAVALGYRAGVLAPWACYLEQLASARGAAGWRLRTRAGEAAIQSRKKGAGCRGGGFFLFGCVRASRRAGSGQARSLPVAVAPRPELVVPSPPRPSCAWPGGRRRAAIRGLAVSAVSLSLSLSASRFVRGRPGSGSPSPLAGAWPPGAPGPACWAGLLAAAGCVAVPPTRAA